MARETSQLEIVISAKDEASGKLSKLFSSAESASASFAKTAGMAIAGASAAISAFAIKGINDYSRIGDEVEKMSKRTGIAAESVSALRVAADMGGTSIETVEGALKKMQVNLIGMASDSKKASTAFKGLGTNFKEIEGMKPEDQFASIGYAISEISDPAQRTAKAVEIFGKAGTELIPLFADMEEGLDGWREKAKELGVSFDEISADKAAKLNDAIGAMKSAFQGVSLTIGGALAPVLIPLLEKVTSLTAEFTNWLNSIGGVQGAISSIQMFLVEHQTALIILAGALTGLLIPAFLAFATSIITVVIPSFIAMAISMAPFLLAGAIIGGIVAGVLWIIKNWDMLSAKAKEIWEGLKKLITDKFNEIKTATDEWLKNIHDSITGVWENIKGTISSVWEGIKSTIGGAIDWIIAKVQSLIDKMRELATMMTGSAVGKAVGGIVNAGKSAVSAIGGLFSGAKAGGGIVNAKSSYLVGENGPEMFTPSNTGRITPNGGMGGGLTVVIQGNSFMGEQDMAVKVGDMIVNRLKLQAKLSI